jgi:hypothetical protein
LEADAAEFYLARWVREKPGRQHPE